MSAVSRSIEINASPEGIYKVISDFENYPEFLSDVHAVTILKRSKASVTARFQIKVIKTLSYVVQFTLNPPYGFRWKQIEGDFFKKNSGGWKLEKKGKKTKATYAIDIEFNLFVPQVISNIILGQHLPNLLKEVKERVES